MLTFHTLLESIALEAWLTDTGGDVVDDGAGGCPATGARAGVDTLLGDAGQPGAAVRVLETLSLTALAGGGVSLEASPAGAENLSGPVLTAVRVGAAG